MSTRTSTQALQPLIAAARATWQKRTPRERQWLRLAALVMLLALTWRLALEPALTTWREAPSRQAALDQKTSQMRQLQAQAKALQKPTTITRAEALRWLEANIPANLGSD
ncbi:MAG: type II secretion system protein GspM, partial [Hydrogenophaga sp.]|nr:type II secretion system protein GspM [Hydrogenophaga sp.]